MTGRFEACLAEVLLREGGYVDHKSDPGGATNMGITRKTLARWRQVSPWWALPKGDVRGLTKVEAGKIYRAGYWKTSRADVMPAGLDLALFDYAVTSGPGQAIRTLQGVLGVVRDGIFGPLTLAAVKAEAGRGGVAKMVGALCDARLGFLKGLSTFSVFGTGWTRRVAAVRAAALAAVGGEVLVDDSTGRDGMGMLSGYKTYLVAVMMIVAAVAQMLGVEVPAMDGRAAGQLIMEAFAIIFLRQGIKGDIGRA